MAVDSTPERSFSLLLRSSRAAEATTGCDAASPRCGVVIIARSVVSIGRCGSERKLATPAQRLVRLGVEHVQDGADQQRVAGLLPVIAPLQRAFRVDQDVGDVLDVADLPFAAADLEQRIVGGAERALVGSNSRHAAEARAPAGGQRPVLALDVVDDRRARPGQQRRHDEADALAATASARSTARARDRRGEDSRRASGRAARRQVPSRPAARTSRVSAQRAEP